MQSRWKAAVGEAAPSVEAEIFVKLRRNINFNIIVF
jgi:hypothetical protein